jgi:predicted ester cyclase
VLKVNLLGEAGKEALMSEENEALVRRSFEDVFNQGNLDAVEEIFASDHVLHDPTSPEEIRGAEGMRGYVRMYRSAFPDLQQTIEDQFAEGEKVATRLMGRGTHQGELMGIAPPATE